MKRVRLVRGARVSGLVLGAALCCAAGVCHALDCVANVAVAALELIDARAGAGIKTAQDTVVQVIEQQMNGIDGLRYMSSTSDSSGSLFRNMAVTHSGLKAAVQNLRSGS